MAEQETLKSEKLKMVEALFGPGSPARLKLEIEVLELQLQLQKQREMAKAVLKFSPLPNPDEKSN